MITMMKVDNGDDNHDIKSDYKDDNDENCNDYDDDDDDITRCDQVCKFYVQPC